MKVSVTLIGFVLAAPLFGAGCESFQGEWDWFAGGVVTFTAPNTILYNGVKAGTWNCTDPAKSAAALRWSNGFVDSVTVSGDRISGKNIQGMAISGVRRRGSQKSGAPPASSPASKPSGASSAGVPAGGVGVVMASGLVQKCLGITQGAPKMVRGPATEPYCKQMPGASLYDQAGQRFAAGDHAGAAKFAASAAEAGNVLAQLRLAMLYEAGDGVPRSAKSALEWYSRAAAQGEPASQMELGGYYEDGDGVPENWDLAVKLYQASATQGWGKGQFALGRAYQFGIGVPQDRQQAIAWFEKSAAQGNSQGAYFARHLRDSLNNIGFRNNMEHDIVIAGKLRFGGEVLGGDPFGVTFHNSAQRVLWLHGQRNRQDKAEAEVWSQIRKAEYDDCRRARRDNCIEPH